MKKEQEQSFFKKEEENGKGIWICKYCKKDRYKGKHSYGFSLCKCVICGEERHCVLLKRGKL